MWCMGAPKKYGGGGLGTFDMCVLMEEMAQHRMGLYNPGASVFGRNPPPVIYGGSEEQIQKYVEPTLKNAWYTFFAITEPSGGSDPAGAIQCRAVREGEPYVLNGRRFSSPMRTRRNGAWSSLAPIRGRPCRHHLPSSSERYAGFHREAVRDPAHGRTAQRGSVRGLPHSGRAADRQEGRWSESMSGLADRLRFPYSACNVGVASQRCGWRLTIRRRARPLAKSFANGRRSNGCSPIPKSRLRAARWLTWDGAWKSGRKEDSRKEASVAKLYSSEVLGRVIDRAVQIHGGYGVSKEFPLERWYRESRIRRIGEGPPKSTAWSSRAISCADLTWSRDLLVSCVSRKTDSAVAI